MLIKQFKRDYFSYFLGIIIPATISFITIPIFKNVLGTSKFGIYTYFVSALFIINASFSGGITQSIIRLQIDYDERNIFFNHSLLLTVIVNILISLPLFVYIQWNYLSLRFSLIFVFTLFVSNLYTALLAITQSKLLSGTSAVSESCRTSIFIFLSLLLLHLIPSANFLLLLFTSLATSYLMGCFFLYLRNDLWVHRKALNLKAFFKTAQSISTYGSYLIGWFLCSYGISMANRFVLAWRFGKENIGHFTASFDIINKSIVLLLSPVLLSLFPLVIKAFANGNHSEVRALIKRLSVTEAILLIACLVTFPFIGFPALSKILHTPSSAEYLLTDMEVISSTFIWQIAMLQHKYLELEKKTGKMLLFVFIAFAVSIITDIFMISAGGIKYAGIGFLAGGIIYFSCIKYYSKKYLY